MTRNLAIFLLATLLLPLPAYALSPGDAQEWLRGKNVPYTADEFVTRAARGDITVMNLFLDAGMDPDAKNKDGRTAMQVAIEQARGEIIKILVDRGADREPLISMIGDKGTLLQDCESCGYIFLRGEVKAFKCLLSIQLTGE